MKIKVLASSSSGNSYLLSSGDQGLLLDAGIPFRNIQKALNFKATELMGCLITHEHL